MLIKYVCCIIIVQTLCVCYAKKSSLTFVIDDTLSMQDDIDQVRKAANKIMDIVTRKKGSEVKNVVLVTFNDEEIVIREKTSKKKKLVDALDDIVVHNPYNYDCPESALSGIVTALENSAQGSYLYVFTDATAKDRYRLNEVKRLCEMKQSQVVFVLTGDCVGYVGEEKGSLMDYYEIAKASNGLVFRVQKHEVIDIVDTIPDIITEQRSVITSRIIPASQRFKPVQFTVDDKTEYVSIHTSGQNVGLLVTEKGKKRRLTFEETLWKSNVKMAKFYAPRTGTYYAWVRGDTAITIVVYARTDFTFDHGFSEFVPKSLADASKQPIADRAHHLSISVTDPEHTVDIKSAEILDMNENLIKTLPLRKASGNFYITDKFISPSKMFKIQVTGTVKRTGIDIKRISKTAIEPQIPPRPASKAPVVIITEGSSVDVDYAGNITLTCKVSGYPPPRIWWTSADGTTVSTKSNAVELPYDYISYLTLSSVKYLGLYYCKAQNEEASDMKPVKVNPKSPFKVLAPADKIPAKYGEKIQIRCDISSSHPMDIQWKMTLKHRLQNALKPFEYTLSDDKKVLTIKSVDLSAEGNYKCKATLKSDKRQMHVVSTDVVISDLAPPRISPTTDTITVPQGVDVHLMCKISGGVPRPRVSWMMKNEEEYKELASGEELTVARASLTDAGTYVCIARNEIGEAKTTTKLIVQVPPAVVIEEGSKKSVSYESSLVITCKVVAFPLPRIGWKNSNGNILPSQEIKTKNVITSRLSLLNIQASDTYTCFAENVLGKTARSFDVEMISPIVVITHPEGVTSSKFGSKTDITCDVRSDYPLRIRWFFKNSSGVSEVQTSDKYKLSATGTTLRILYTDLDSVGAYSCEASLATDQKQKIVFTTNVQLGDLTAPVLQNTHPKELTVNSNDKVKIPCTIVAGNPPPVVSWQVMKKGDESFKELSASGQELVIDSAALSDAGMYRCDARNVKGQAHKTTELNVQQAPEGFIAEGTTVTVPYRGTNEFTCHIVALPLPKIVWRDSKGNALHAMDNVDIIKNEVVSRLRVNNIKTSDTFTCHAANVLGETTVAVQVSVLPSIDLPIHPPETISVKYEEPTTLFCDAQSSLPIKINWYYQKDGLSPKSEILTSDKYMISADERNLLIMSTRLDHVGKYTCEASLIDDKNEKKSYTTNIKIKDLEAPTITYSNDTITVKKGEPMSAFCIADGTPKPVLTWQFKSKVADVFTALPNKRERISIPKIGYKKAGLYKCTATNAVGTQSQSISVVVNGEPRINNVDSVYFGVTGDKVLKIPCEVEGVPEPTITWTSGDKVVTSDAKLSVNKNTLYIKNPTEKDSNNFTCTARNTYGYDMKTFTADISDFITYNEELNSNIYLKLGESTDIKCLLPHSDPQSIRWYVNGEISKVFGTYYSIKNAQYSNDGNYTCRLNTEEGSKSLNYVVDVGYKPSFMTTPPATIDWKGDKEDTLDCYVRAKPRVKVQWFYNGKPLDATLPGLSIFGWGQYTCKVSNVHDSVERTFNVTSSGCLINRTAVNAQNIPLFVDDEPIAWPSLATTSEFYTLSENEMITLECATQDQPDNTFKAIPNAKKINAKCYKEDTFIVDGKMYKINDLQCKTYVRSSQLFTEKSCMKKGEVIEVGFKLNEGFLGVYEVCYSGLDRRTLYTKVMMSAVNRGNIVAPSFKHRGTKGGGHGAEPRKCAYSKRLLVNPEDVAFGPAQAATLSDDHNAVVVYEPCEGASRWTWSDVEKTVTSALYGSDAITVWTGASQYDSGIPRYLWKVVMFDDGTFETIVYVNAANPSSSDVLCPETSPDRFTDVSDAHDQYTYICSMEDFSEAFKVPLTDFTSIFR